MHEKKKEKNRGASCTNTADCEDAETPVPEARATEKAAADDENCHESADAKPAEGGFTKQQLEELDKQNDAQNTKVNGCLIACIQMLEDTLLKIAKTVHFLATTELSKAKCTLRDVTQAEVSQAEKN